MYPLLSLTDGASLTILLSSLSFLCLLLLLICCCCNKDQDGVENLLKQDGVRKALAQAAEDAIYDDSVLAVNLYSPIKRGLGQV